MVREQVSRLDDKRGASMSVICHWCNGTGKEEDAVKAAAYPDHCINCGGSGAEPVYDEEGETDDDVCNQCGYLMMVCRCE
jgi:DnaJ-class molecular chaperone